MEANFQNYQSYTNDLTKFVKNLIKSELDILPKVQIAKVLSISGLELTLQSPYNNSTFKGWLIQNATLNTTIDITPAVNSIVLCIPTFLTSVSLMSTPIFKLPNIQNTGEYYCLPIQTAYDIPKSATSITIDEVKMSKTTVALTSPSGAVTGTPEIVIGV